MNNLLGVATCANIYCQTYTNFTTVQTRKQNQELIPLSMTQSNDPSWKKLISLTSICTSINTLSVTTRCIQYSKYPHACPQMEKKEEARNETKRKMKGGKN